MGFTNFILQDITMTIQSTPVCTPSYRLLSTGQIERIHAATLELLETVGVNIGHPGARGMMAEAGCTVRNDGTVLIPGQLVADAIQSAPSSVILYNRFGEKARDILRSYTLKALDPSVHEEPDRIRSDADRQLKGVQFRT